MSGPRAEPDPWRELDRRRVVRVTISYLAVSFATLEAALVVLPLVAAPAWVFRAVLGAVVLGFPPSIVLAWRYDVTPQGIVRTPDDPPAQEGASGPPWGWVLGVSSAAALGLVLEFLR